MVLVKFKPSSSLYSEYYRQRGEGFKGDVFQYGYGYQTGYQRGQGLGNIFSKIRFSPMTIKLKNMIKPVVKRALVKSLPLLERAGKKAGDHLLNVSKESIKDILKSKKSGKEVMEKQKNALKRKLTEIALETMEGKGRHKKKRKHNSEDDDYKNNILTQDKGIFSDNSLSSVQPLDMSKSIEVKNKIGGKNKHTKQKSISASSTESGSDSDIFL